MKAGSVHERVATRLENRDKLAHAPGDAKVSANMQRSAYAASGGAEHMSHLAAHAHG